MSSFHYPAPGFEPRLPLEDPGFLFALLDMGDVASGFHGFLCRLSFVSGISTEMFEPLVPKSAERDPNKTYLRKRGAGRKPLPDKQAFAAIVYVLRTGIQWNALPREFGSSSAVHRRFQFWEEAGFFRRIWAAGLAEYDGLHGIAWEWQSIDGALNKAPLATACVGPNPTDRGKKWTQAQPAHRRAWHPAVAHRCRSQPP